MSDTPVLYSYSGCPYCLRAHMALKYAGLKVILREVDVDDLPDEARAVSSHATVPSLVISADDYLDESWDIVKWAVQQNDPASWLGKDQEYLLDAEILVETNDHSFKDDLDHYKAGAREAGEPADYYRQRGEEFLQELTEMLELNEFLLAPHLSIADIAVFPFVREFAKVDQAWFAQSYPRLQAWLDFILATDWFGEATKRYKIWQPGSEDIYL